jgi:hypothetical protein
MVLCSEESVDFIHNNARFALSLFAIMIKFCCTNANIKIFCVFILQIVVFITVRLISVALSETSTLEKMIAI